MEELPPGFRFYPTEEELISFYLHHKLQGTRPDLDRVIPVVDIYSHEPWELPMMARERGRGENEEQWFFFTAQQEREAQGGKPNRTTATGYWKATGSPGYVFSTTMHTKGIGVKKTMVFYKGRAPVGKKTHWKMNEYKAIDFAPAHILDASSSNAPAITKLRHEMSVCRVYITSGSSRAFDRRPFGSITTLRAPHLQQPLRLQSADHHHQLTTTTTTTTLSTGHANINAPVLVETSSSSTDSSRSGGDQKDHQQSSSNNMNNDDDDEEMITSGLQPLWEWEQLNWCENMSFLHGKFGE